MPGLYWHNTGTPFSCCANIVEVTDLNTEILSISSNRKHCEGNKLGEWEDGT